MKHWRDTQSGVLPIINQNQKSFGSLAEYQPEPEPERLHGFSMFDVPKSETSHRYGDLSQHINKQYQGRNIQSPVTSSIPEQT